MYWRYGAKGREHVRRPGRRAGASTQVGCTGRQVRPDQRCISNWTLGSQRKKSCDIHPGVAVGYTSWYVWWLYPRPNQVLPGTQVNIASIGSLGVDSCPHRVSAVHEPHELSLLISFFGLTGTSVPVRDVVVGLCGVVRDLHCSRDSCLCTVAFARSSP